MQYFHMRLLVSNSHLNCVPNNALRLPFSCMVDEHLQRSFGQSNHQIYLNITSRSHMSIIHNSFLRASSYGTLQTNVKAGDSSKIARCIQPQENTCVLQDQILDKEFRIDNSTDNLKRLDKDNKEIQRRRKISQANKGKTPWNKGIKHSAETRKLIKQRTIEALRDPKIRRRMSACPRSHSEESKAKIGIAQKRVWRLRWKRMRLSEKVYLIWADSIAEAARRGAYGQEELNWDSYEKIKAQISLQQLQLAADKAKAKEATKLRAAKEKAKKFALMAKRREEKEQKVKESRTLKRRSRRKLKEEKGESAIPKGLTLKARISKIRWKKPVEGEVEIKGDPTTGHHQSTIEKLDLDFIRREKLRREVSLADQIQAAKKKRTKSAAKQEALTTSSSNFLADERCGDALLAAVDSYGAGYVSMCCRSSNYKKMVSNLSWEKSLRSGRH